MSNSHSTPCLIGIISNYTVCVQQANFCQLVEIVIFVIELAVLDEVAVGIVAIKEIIKQGDTQVFWNHSPIQSGLHYCPELSDKVIDFFLLSLKIFIADTPPVILYANPSLPQLIHQLNLMGAQIFVLPHVLD